MKKIILQKQREITALELMISGKPDHNIHKILQQKLQRTSLKSFKKSLKNSGLSVIAEIKRQSPSKGRLAEIPEPLALAKSYIHSQATAISVLTDHHFFGGTLADLERITRFLEKYPHPVLRKDFILHPIQIAESITAGADAILGIVTVLGNNINNIKSMIDISHCYNIDIIIEVHDQAELDTALRAGAEIIGINNRNLRTFEINTETALKLIENIPDNIITIAESGILTPALAQKYFQAGFDAVLIGEALVRSSCPKAFIKACHYE